MMRVPSAAPAADEAEIEAVAAVLRSGSLANGSGALRLEEEFSELCGGVPAMAVSSGTDALYMAGRAAGLGPGAKVLASGFSFAATANAFLALGAEVVPVDIDLATFNISPESLTATLERHPDASCLVVVDLYGSTAGTDRCVEIAKGAGLTVIEDACQAHGALTESGEPLGRRAAFTAFSLYATKNVAAGEGGILTAPDEKVARQLRLLRNHGCETAYVHEIVGLNHRLPEMSAALARVRLERLAAGNTRRLENAALLAAACADSWPSSIVPVVPADGTHVVHQFTVLAPDREGRDRTADRLHSLGVDSRIHYPYTLAELPLVVPEELPNAAAARDRVISLPVHPGLSDEQIQILEDAIATVGAEGWQG